MSILAADWLPRDIGRFVDQQTASIQGYVATLLRTEHAAGIGRIGPDSTSPFFLANQRLVTQRRALLDAKVWEAYDEALIRDLAENYARKCADLPQLAAREQFALEVDIEPPAGKFLTDRYEARARRLADPLWWRRRLRNRWLRRAEEAMRCIGVVRKGRCAYASDSAVYHRGGQKRRVRSYCEAHVATNELGEQLGLFDLQQGSVANPALRRGELMTRVRGFEELADFRGDVALFFSLTTPSRFHPQLAAGGANPAYAGATVREAQAWLCQCWARVRAALHRKKITLYGFRVAEPHHDGTPHWHGLFFMRPDAADAVRAVVARVFLSDAGDEPGARAHRVRVETIDKARGSAAGYIAKYVAKNIDGHGSIGVASDLETAAPVAEGVMRVDAWAALHGIRQFQQIGGPPVGLWREARRLRDAVDDVDIERVRRRADKGDWCGFCRSVGGEGTSRKTSVKIWREETGEANKYGECRPARTLGLVCTSVTVVTRPHRWRIEKKGRCQQRGGVGASSLRSVPAIGADSSSESGSSLPLGPVAITVRGRRARLVLGVPPRWVYDNDEAAGDTRGAIH